MKARRGIRRSVAMSVSAIALLAATAANVAPLALTEANWTDNVNVKTSLTASQHAGVNYARSAASNGTVTRGITTGTLVGTVASVNNTAPPGHLDTGANTFDTGGIFSFIYFESKAQSCARANTTPCLSESISPPAYAASKFSSMAVKTSRNGIVIADLVEGQPSIETTATCVNGTSGSPWIKPGSSIRLRNASNFWGIPQYINLPVPTVSGTSNTATGTITGLWDYRTKLTYNSSYGLNHAHSEVRLRIDAVFLGIGDSDTWALDILLSRAECGLSQPLSGGVFSTTGDRGIAADLTKTDALAVNAKVDEETILEDHLDEVQLSETTTSAPPNPSEEGESPTTGTSTAGPTSTLTSEVPTVSTTPTSTTTPPATKTVTSTSAAPAPVIPDEPGPLSATARLEDVGTVEVDWEDLAVVVRGTTVPTDARTGPTALDRWINDGIQSTGNWKAFTSDDPAADGWRWAAINQETGTVVYVR